MMDEDSVGIIGNRFLDINISLTSGVFPQEWKCSLITPIQKIQNTTSIEQFQPPTNAPPYEHILKIAIAVRTLPRSRTKDTTRVSPFGLCLDDAGFHIARGEAPLVGLASDSSASVFQDGGSVVLSGLPI
ncbi:hypothetical protein Trydic_g6515 [Trypoxylus dichotomus]